MDLFSRRVVGWSMKPTLAREIVLDALMMAVWRRKPRSRVLFTQIKGLNMEATTGDDSVFTTILNPV